LNKSLLQSCTLAFALTCLLLPAMAVADTATEAPVVSSEPAVADSAADTATPVPADGLLAGDEQIVFLSSCTAEKTDCWGGGSVSCSGNDSCNVVYNGVNCDGVLSRCPCDPAPSCQGGNGEAYCDCRNAGGSHGICACQWCITCP
jgi:hypothetical protein